MNREEHIGPRDPELDKRITMLAVIAVDDLSQIGVTFDANQMDFIEARYRDVIERARAEYLFDQEIPDNQLDPHQPSDEWMTAMYLEGRLGG